MDADAQKGMNRYIATFWTHFAATSTLSALEKAGIEALARPVPRTLSAGCGTCVCYTASDPCPAFLHQDYEQVVRLVSTGYETVMVNDEAL